LQIADCRLQIADCRLPASPREAREGGVQGRWCWKHHRPFI
jgi:hypothetical protein